MTTTRKGQLRIPSRQVRRQLPERVVVFLRGVSSNDAVRAILANAGYDEAEHQEGTRLLNATYPYRSTNSAAFEDEAKRAARTEVTEWSKANVRRLRLMFERLFPEHMAVFEGAAVAEASNPVLAVVTILERLEALSATNEAVRTTLERRGPNAAERGRLRALLERAHAAGPARPTENKGDADEALIELYRWHSDWAATARTHIARRDTLISLGLAGRARRREAEFFAEDDETTTTGETE